MNYSNIMQQIGRPIAYHPGLVPILGSVNAVLFFGQIFYWQDKASSELGVYKTADDIQNETGLSYREQATAREKLRALGVLIETEKRIEHRIYFKIDMAVFDALLAGEKAEIRERQDRNPRATKAQSPNDENAFRETTKAQSVNTMITTMTTAMNTSSSDDDEARLREMRDKQRQEQDERIRFPMTAEWTPDAKILNDHLRFAGPNGMLNGKPVIAEDLTEEILAGFRSLAFRRQESCTKHDWHGGLASYLVKSLKNGPKPGNVHQIPSASSQETKPKGDGSLWYCSQPLPKRPPREERTDEEIAAMIAEGRKAMEAAR